MPLVAVDRDGFELTQSCRVTFSGPLADAGGDGVARVSTPGITLDFEAVLLRVEHFELDGSATLSVELEPVEQRRLRRERRWSRSAGLRRAGRCACAEVSPMV